MSYNDAASVLHKTSKQIDKLLQPERKESKVHSTSERMELLQKRTIEIKKSGRSKRSGLPSGRAIRLVR